MRESALLLRSQSQHELKVTFGSSVGAFDFEVALTPVVDGFAAISWAKLADSFIVSVSPRCEWQSQDFIAYDEDETAYTESAFNWSLQMVRRIASHGARFVRFRSSRPVVLRETRAIVGDEKVRRPHDVLESWIGWFPTDPARQNW